MCMWEKVGKSGEFDEKEKDLCLLVSSGIQ